MKDDYGKIVLHISDILEQKGISRNKICKDLDIPRTNFNRYCRGDFQRIDVGLLCKLLNYLDCSVDELIEYMRP